MRDIQPCPTSSFTAHARYLLVTLIRLSYTPALEKHTDTTCAAARGHEACLSVNFINEVADALVYRALW